MSIIYTITMEKILIEYAHLGAKLRTESFAIYIQELLSSGKLLANALSNGNKLLYCGNGGSAAEAQHIAAELVGRFSELERPSLPALALTTDTSIITAIANDYSFEKIFAKQVEAFGTKGDILIASSTSGNSKNVIEAIHVAQDKGMDIIGLTGEGGGKMATLCTILFAIPTTHTPLIQEIHLAFQHTLCAMIETILFKD